MIRNGPLAVFSAGAALVVLFIAAQRVIFLNKAERTAGEVFTIDANNGRCGTGGRGSRRYHCTKFMANVVFSTRTGRRGSFNLGAGRARGWDRDISAASYAVGQSVPVVYNPSNPMQAYHDTLMGVWGSALIALLVQFATLIGAILPPRSLR